MENRQFYKRPNGNWGYTDEHGNFHGLVAGTCVWSYVGYRISVRIIGDWFFINGVDVTTIQKSATPGDNYLSIAEFESATADFFEASGDGGDISQRVTNLENRILKVYYYAEITTISGTISKPQGATILLNQWENGEDALVCSIEGVPTFDPSLSIVSSFDINGNYTISGGLPSNPAAIIYVIEISRLNFDLYVQNNRIISYFETLQFENIILPFDKEIVLGIPTTKAPYAWYHLNDSVGTIASDASGNLRTLSFVNTPVWDLVLKKLGESSISITGASQRLASSNAIDFGFDFNTPFSFEGWFLCAAVSGAERILFSKASSETNGFFLKVTIAGLLDCVLASSNSSRLIRKRGTFNFEDNLNVWFHVAVIYDGTGTLSGLNIYVNNAIDTVSLSSANIEASDTLLVADVFQLSGISGGSTACVNFLIDEFVVYDWKLSAAELSARYNSGAGTQDIGDIQNVFHIVNKGSTQQIEMFWGNEVSRITISRNRIISINGITIDSQTLTKVATGITGNDTIPTKGYVDTYEGKVKIVNKTGANSVKGMVVAVSTVTDNSFMVNPIDGDFPMGIVYEDGIADGQETWVTVSGKAQVLLVDAVATTRGYIMVSSSTTAGRVDTTLAIPTPVVHFREIGHVLESKTAGTNVLVWAIIHFN